MTTGLTYTGSFYAKAAEISQIGFDVGQGYANVNFNLANGTYTSLGGAAPVSAFDGNTILAASGDATGEIAKSAVAHSAENSSAVLNGGIVVSANLSPMLWKGTMLNIGNTPNTFNGWIRNVKYYPNKLSDNQIKTMTS